MNDFAWNILWPLAQVSLFLAAGSLLYLLARRFGPRLGASAALAVLLLALLVTVAGFAAAPRWWTMPVDTWVASWDFDSGAPADQENKPIDDAPQQSTADNAAAASPVLESPEPFDIAEGSTPSISSSPPNLSALPGAAPSPWWLLMAILPAGALLMLARLALGVVAVRRCRARSEPIEDEAASETLVTLRSQMKCRREVELRETHEVSTPAMVGWRRPAILLPIEWSTWSAEELRAVLAHELAHVARGDYVASLAAQFTRALHFYNPLVYWLAARLRLEQELAADAVATEQAGGRKRYLTALASLALAADARPVPWPARPFLPGRGTLLRRIDMLRHEKRADLSGGSDRTGIARFALIVMLSLSAVLASGLKGPLDVTPAPALAGGSMLASQEKPADTLQEVRHFEKGGTVYSVAFSSDSMVAIAGGNYWDSPARFYEIDTGKETGRIEAARNETVFIAVSPDQRYLAGLGVLSAPIRLFNLETSELEHTLPHPPVAWALDFSPDSRTLASAGPDQTLRLWDVESGVEVRSISGQSPRLYSVDFSPNGQWIASAGNDKIVRICDVSSGNELVKLEHPDVVWCVEFSPDGRFLATGTGGDLLNYVQERYGRGNDNRLRLWDASTGELIREFEGHTHTIRGLAFTPDGTRVLTGSLDGTLRLWDLIGGSELARIDSQTWVHDVAVSPDGKYALASGGALKNDIGAWMQVPEERVRLFRLHRAELPYRRGAEAVSAPQQATALSARRQPANESEIAMRAWSANRLKMIGVALHNYHSVHGHFPPVATYDDEGNPLLSWRVLILPYLETGGQALYDQFRLDEPWDSEHNKRLLDKMPDVFHFPGDPKGTTNAAYFGIAGDVTVFPPDHAVSIREITDGTSQTIMLVESKRDIPWTKPEDIPYDTKGEMPKFGGYSKDGFNTARADGSVHFMPENVDPEMLRKLFTKAGQEVVDSPKAVPASTVRQADRVSMLIENLKSNQTFANRFAVQQCEAFGPEVIGALPALRDLRARRANDPNFIAKIDAAIAAVEGPSQVDARTGSMNNMKMIGIALHNYHAVHGHFPPVATYDEDGNPLLSWRVLILPYLEIPAGDELYNEFRLDEPWDSEHNKKLLDRMPDLYHFPGDPKRTNNASYFGVVGSETVFPPKKGTRISDITDGSSATIMLIEAKRDIPWTKPEDIPYKPKGEFPKLGGYQKGGFNTAFADGSVHFISDNVDPDVLRKLFTKAGQEPVKLPFD